MLESVGSETPSDDISDAIYYLVKEVGLSHEEIFGGTEVVQTTETEPRQGVLGGLVDYLFGERKKDRLETVEKRGMSLTTLVSYMDLLEKEQEEKEKQRKKQKLRNSMKNATMG